MTSLYKHREKMGHQDGIDMNLKEKHSRIFFVNFEGNFKFTIVVLGWIETLSTSFIVASE
jgi:hypothetical protein